MQGLPLYAAHTPGRGPFYANHFVNCKTCRLTRLRNGIREQQKAHAKGCLRARLAGAPPPHRPSPILEQYKAAQFRKHEKASHDYEVEVEYIMGGCRKIAANDKSVTIQLANEEKPVTPFQEPSPRSRKRGYSAVDEPDIGILPFVFAEPLPRLLQIALYVPPRPAPAPRPGNSSPELPLGNPPFRYPGVLPKQHSHSAVVDASCQQVAQPTPGAFPTWADSAADADAMDIDTPPATRTVARFPSTPARTAHSGASPLLRSADMTSLPGAWPSWQDSDDVQNDVPNPPTRGTTGSTPFGRVFSTLTHLYARVFGRSSRAANNTPDDGGPESSKRIRISRQEPPATPVSGPSSSHRPSRGDNTIATPASRLQASNLISTDGIRPRPTATQQETPPPEEVSPSPRALPKQTRKPLGTPKYSNLAELFDREEEISLPGLVPTRLSPSSGKVDELDWQRNERLRAAEELRLAKQRAREAEERARAAKERARVEKERRIAEERARAELEALYGKSLASLGLRRPKGALITPLSSEWDKKARATVQNGVAKVPNPEGTEVSNHDFAKLVPNSAWLNDNIIQAILALLAHEINDSAGVVLKKNAPKCVALSPLYWQHISTKGASGSDRRLKRTWGATPENFFEIDTFLLPINHGSHWTVIVIRPSRRTIAYVDSFHSRGSRELGTAFNFLKGFLGSRYKEDEWQTVQYNVPKQTNSYDCGMFVITNSIYLALGVDPSSYSQADMPLMRLRMAAMLLNGGFKGDFSLRAL
ncbi:hypothetical protein DL764_010951 [Monosporascus ibericus]|uniref:Ubiquitin-like protease family profile domain-containing protein n=1 Tax=Monosporascus ibericus TaxID=155417 RepID=A0A4Q4SU46_9PEZI|nr:hypothetical protein DL764_010951 [Monosporascus ibericus]